VPRLFIGEIAVGSLLKFAVSFAALCVAPLAFAQSIASNGPKTAPQVLASPQTQVQTQLQTQLQAPTPDVGKVLAQTFTEQDIELITLSLRDALAGHQVDERRMAPLAQKMEGVAALLFREMLTQSFPMIDSLEGELKKELRRLKEAKPQ
jgi:hypothetical protein